MLPLDENNQTAPWRRKTKNAKKFAQRPVNSIFATSLGV
jgi:hypothetical protein